MYSFLVLGMIPGTDIQINFTAWSILAVIVLALVFWLPSERRRHQTRVNIMKIEAFNASLRKLDGEIKT